MAMKMPTKSGVQNDITKSETVFEAVKIAFMIEPSAQVCFFVVELEVDERAEHLQIGDQRVELGRICRPCRRSCAPGPSDSAC